MSERKSRIVRSSLKQKIEGIRAAFVAMEIEIPNEDQEGILEYIINFVDIRDNIEEELRNHPGVYAYVVSIQEHLRSDLEDAEAVYKSTKESIDQTIDLIVSSMRDELKGTKKITKERKEEIANQIKTGNFNLDYYNDADVDTWVKFCVNKYKDLIFQETEAFHAKRKLNFVAEICSALAYQKNMALKALVDLHTSGIYQEIK